MTTGVDVSYRWITEHEQEMENLRRPPRLRREATEPLIGVGVSYLLPNGEQIMMVYYMRASEYPGV